MTKTIRQAMEECAGDLATGEWRLRALLELDGDRFVQASLGLVESGRDFPGCHLPEQPKHLTRVELARRLYRCHQVADDPANDMPRP